MTEQKETLKISEMTTVHDDEESNPFYDDDEAPMSPKIYEYETGLEVEETSSFQIPNNRKKKKEYPLRFIDMSRCETGEWGNARPFFKIFDITFILGPGCQPISPIIICTIVLSCYIAINYNLNLVDHPGFVNIIIAFGGLGLFGVIFFTAFTDPGFIKRKPNQRIIKKHRDEIYCFKCMVSYAEAKKHKVMHCFDCDRCSRYHDHHCPVLGNCIAEKNIYTFYGMIAFFAIAVGCAYLALYFMVISETKGDLREAIKELAANAAAPHKIIKKVMKAVGNKNRDIDN